MSLTPRTRASVVIDRRRELSKARRPSLRDRLIRVYIVVLGVAIYGSMVFSAMSHANIGESCSADARCIDASETALFAWGIAILSAGALAAGVSALGPASASAGEASWLLSTPVDRARILWPAVVRATVFTGFVAGVAGWFSWHAAGGGTGADEPMVAAILGGVTIGIAIAATACWAQANRRVDSWWRRVPTVLTVVGFLACLSSILHLEVVPGNAEDLHLGGWLALPAVLLAAGLLAGAAKNLRKIPSSRLRESGRLQESVFTTMVSMDLSHASRQFSSQPRAPIFRRRTRRGYASGMTALLVRDLMSLSRRPQLWVGVVVATLVPSLFLILVGPLMALISMIVTASCVARVAAVGLFTMTRSPGVARSFPLTTVQIRLALIVSPLLVVLVWITAVAFLTSTGPVVAVSIALGGLAGACRAAGGMPVGTTGVLVMTSSGVLPLSMVASLVRGFDVAFLSAIPILLGLAMPLAIAFPLFFVALHVVRPARGWLAR